MKIKEKVKDIISSVIDEETEISGNPQAVTFRLNPDDYSEFMLLTEEMKLSKAALAKMLCRASLKDATEAFIEELGSDYENSEKEYKSMVSDVKHELFPDEPPYKTVQQQKQMFKRMPRGA